MDVVRFAVVPVPEEVDRGFEVQVFVNEVEMTRAGAGLGMDTNDVLVPVNRFRPDAGGPTRTPVARCECGVYGCGSTDVVITLDGDRVHWDSQIETPVDRRMTFDRDAYMTEVDRLESDRSWETPERVAVRLVTTAGLPGELVGLGFSQSWASNYYADHSIFQVALVLDDRYQVFLSVPWDDRTPVELADEVARVLGSDPSSWTADWLLMDPKLGDVHPPMTGPGWTKISF